MKENDEMNIRGKSIKDWLDFGYEKVKNKIDQSIGYKLLISSFLGAVGGAGFMGFISEYATYIYALNYGIRLPVEGVPYLKIAITTSSFMLLFFSGLSFFAIYLVLILVKNL